jgi:hypothetical protein
MNKDVNKLNWVLAVEARFNGGAQFRKKGFCYWAIMTIGDDPEQSVCHLVFLPRGFYALSACSQPLVFYVS